MAEKRKKIILFNTLLLIFCCVIIALFCWSPKEEIVLEKYKINFETDGGTAIAAIEIEEGKIPEKPKDPTREGYVFVGWMLGDELYDFTTAVEGDVTLKAVWKELDPDKTYYIITIDLGDGTTTSQPVEEGGLPIPPTTPSRPGFNFLGWELNGEPYDFNTPVTGDATIVAKWEEVQTEPEPDPNEDREYTVKFNLNGGTGSYPDQVVKHGQRATNPGNPSRNGYTFAGWSPNINTVITRDITFVAQWSLIPVEPSKFPVWYIFNDNYYCENQHLVIEGSGIVPNCNVPLPAHHHFKTDWKCPSTMPSGGATCTRTSEVNTFEVSCSSFGDNGTTNNCSFKIFENKQEVGGTVYINGIQASTFNYNVWMNQNFPIRVVLNDGFSADAIASK